MRKGIYSAVIALMALVLATALIASSMQSAVQQESHYSAIAVDVKREWQSLRYLLDKATSDAIGDAAYENCSYNQREIEQRIQDYLRSVASAWGNGCSTTLQSVNALEDNIEVVATIKCEKNLGKFKASYERQVTFNKKLEIEQREPCYLNVVDLQSGVLEATSLASISVVPNPIQLMQPTITVTTIQQVDSVTASIYSNPITVRCNSNDGMVWNCNPSQQQELSSGVHRIVFEIVDMSGNAIEITRTFVVGESEMLSNEFSEIERELNGIERNLGEIGESE